MSAHAGDQAVARTKDGRPIFAILAGMGLSARLDSAILPRCVLYRSLKEMKFLPCPRRKEDGDFATQIEFSSLDDLGCLESTRQSFYRNTTSPPVK
jgi:hypothetical protein